MNLTYYIGRRKKACAVLIVKGKEMLYNGTELTNIPELNYFASLTKLKGFVIIAKGGGTHAQLQAARLALAKYIIENKPQLKTTLELVEQNILTSDARQKETKKAQCHGARATRQKSYR